MFVLWDKQLPPPTLVSQEYNSYISRGWCRFRDLFLGGKHPPPGFPHSGTDCKYSRGCLKEVSHFVWITPLHRYAAHNYTTISQLNHSINLTVLRWYFTSSQELSTLNIKMYFSCTFVRKCMLYVPLQFLVTSPQGSQPKHLIN